MSGKTEITIQHKVLLYNEPSFTYYNFSQLMCRVEVPYQLIFPIAVPAACHRNGNCVRMLKDLKKRRVQQRVCTWCHCMRSLPGSPPLWMANTTVSICYNEFTWRKLQNDKSHFATDCRKKFWMKFRQKYLHLQKRTEAVWSNTFQRAVKHELTQNGFRNET